MRAGRYTLGARWYDVISGERPVYRIGRERAIDLLGLGAGDTVLDIGCGTGLNLPLLRRATGPEGEIVGVDASPDMLEMARRRSRWWPEVSLVESDAGTMTTAIGDWRFDAVIATYSLSIIGDWKAAWEQALERVRPGGRVGVVDLATPTGWGTLLAPAARLACLTGGVHRDREPWRLVEELDDVVVERHRSGHVVVAVGRVPGETS